MSKFDEWWKDESLNTFDYPSESAEAGFEAGEQSRQAEIDELQKRIDEALRELMVYKNIQTAVIALKGNQNEN